MVRARVVFRFNRTASGDHHGYLAREPFFVVVVFPRKFDIKLNSFKRYGAKYQHPLPMSV